MSAKGNAASAEARTASAAKRAADLLPVISGLQDDGFDSIVGIAAKQNERGITAARGGTWSAVQVRRVRIGQHSPDDKYHSRAHVQHSCGSDNAWWRALSVVSAFAAAANGATAAQVIVMGASTGVGSVTSVGLTVPSWQSVSGSPVTSAGTLAVTDNNQNANLVFAGPSSGTAAAPTFRALVSADVPSSLTNPMTTKGDIIYGGVSGAPTRLAAGTSRQVLQTNGSSAAPSWVAAGGGGSGALTQIAQQVLGSSAASVTFFSIPGTYTSLILKFACKERAGRAIAFCSSTVTRPPTTTTTTSTTLAEDRQAARAGRSTLRLSSTTPTLASRRTRWL